MIASSCRFPQALLCMLFALAAAGCSGLRSSDPVTQVYPLQPRAADAAPAVAALSAAAPSAAALAVVLPVAAPGLNSINIALLRADGVLDAYSGSRWPEVLPEVLRPLIVDALRAGGHFASVQSDTGLFRADYLLQVEVRQFAAMYSGDVHSSTPTVQVQLVVTLGRRADRGVLRSYSVDVAVPASANRMAAVIEAFNRATGTALQQLTEETRLAQ